MLSPTDWGYTFRAYFGCLSLSWAHFCVDLDRIGQIFRSRSRWEFSVVVSMEIPMITLFGFGMLGLERLVFSDGGKICV